MKFWNKIKKENLVLLKMHIYAFNKININFYWEIIYIQLVSRWFYQLYVYNLLRYILVIYYTILNVLYYLFHFIIISLFIIYNFQ